MLDSSDIGEVTKRDVEDITQVANYGTGHGAREAMGRVWIDKDYEARRKRVLNTLLP